MQDLTRCFWMMDDAAITHSDSVSCSLVFVFFKELVQYVRCATQRKEFKMSAFWSCMLKEFTATEPEAKFLVILCSLYKYLTGGPAI
jgi:hypothetical protein